MENQLPALKEKAENVAVQAEDVAKVIELWTGVPAVKISKATPLA